MDVSLSTPGLPDPLELAVRMAIRLPRRIKRFLLSRLPAQSLDTLLDGVPLGRNARVELERILSGPELPRTIGALERGEMHLLLPGSPNWPALLEEMPDPPMALFARGRPDLLARDSVAVVGTRRPVTQAGRLAEQLGELLGGLGLLCVSGGAMGVDSRAHAGAGPARTCAVLGCGLEWIWPRENRALLEAIGREGVLLSEYPPWFQAQTWSFPRRNRLISGLSRAVIVVQAPARSGALITAATALDQNRELWVCAGPWEDAAWEGSHRLIREGARLLGKRDHVLEELATLPLKARLRPPETERRSDHASSMRDPEQGRLLGQEWARTLLRHLDPPPTLDLLAQRLGMRAGELTGKLLELELAGLVSHQPGDRWIRLEPGH